MVTVIAAVNSTDEPDDIVTAAAMAHSAVAVDNLLCDHNCCPLAGTLSVLPVSPPPSEKAVSEYMGSLS